MAKLVTEKVYKIVATGDGKKYPRINLPPELASCVGKLYWIEKEGDTIILRPVERRSK